MNTQETINFAEFLKELLATLTEREQQVLINRYQLTADLVKYKTLREVGERYGITRERVRQIERDAVKKLVKNSQDSQFKNILNILESNLVTYLEKNGGLVNEDHLVNDYVVKHNLDKYHNKSFLFILDKLTDSVNFVNDTDHFYPHWHLVDLKIEKIKDLIDKLVLEIESLSKSLKTDSLHKLVEEKVLADDHKEYLDKFVNKHEGLTNRDVINAYLRATRKVEKNILEQWGLSHWSNIRPKKLADKVDLIFSRESKPLHFTEAADLLNNANFDHKKVCAATVHNELISNPRYVLIGRGVYGYKEWGYVTGTVADVIIKVLQDENRAMTRDEIYQEVLKQRKVNPSTIYLALLNKDKFKQVEKGKFFLI